MRDPHGLINFQCNLCIQHQTRIHRASHAQNIWPNVCSNARQRTHTLHYTEQTHTHTHCITLLHSWESSCLFHFYTIHQFIHFALYSFRFCRSFRCSVLCNLNHWHSFGWSSQTKKKKQKNLPTNTQPQHYFPIDRVSQFLSCTFNRNILHYLFIVWWVWFKIFFKLNLPESHIHLLNENVKMDPFVCIVVEEEKHSKNS